MKAAGRGRRSSGSRIIGYAFDGDFSELLLEKLLEGDLARGVITQWDKGNSDRGVFVWFNGRPGEALRGLRKQVCALATRFVVCTHG